MRHFRSRRRYTLPKVWRLGSRVKDTRSVTAVTPDTTRSWLGSLAGRLKLNTATRVPIAMNGVSRSRTQLITFVCLFLTPILLAASPQDTRNPPVQRAQPRRDAHVIMISIDGLVPDYYLEPARLGL